MDIDKLKSRALFSPSLENWLLSDIKYKHTDIIMLVLAFGSAMVDTMTLPIFSVFVANNTGNLLLLGLGAAGLGKQYPELVYADRAGVALVGSWLGSFLTGRIGRWAGVKKRWWLFSEFAFQSLLIFTPAILLYTNAVSITKNTNLVVIFLLGWSFGSQSVATKYLGIPAIAVQVVTGAMGDLLSDANLFAPLRSNIQRNQRFIFILTFFIGSIVGGLILIHTSGNLVLLLTGVFKLIGAIAFLLIPTFEEKPVIITDKETTTGSVIISVLKE